MATKVYKEKRQKIFKATLKLASSHEWGALRLDQIARQAKVSVSEITYQYKTPFDILPEIIEDFSHSVAKVAGKSTENTSPRDRLFEILMARFDLLQQNRQAILNILTYIKKNPSLVPKLLCAQHQAMKYMLEIAHIKSKSFQPLITAGLLATYAMALKTWQHDSTHDMSKTMVVLDRSLRYSSKVAEIILRSK